MAIVKQIKMEMSKKIAPKSSTSLVYTMNDELFSIATYREGDDTGEYGTKQSLQFNHDMAKQLRDALSIFLKS